MPTNARDQYKGKIKETACGVINLDSSSGPGTHFTCFFNSPAQKNAIYFDSYGAVPPQEIVDFLKTSGKQIAYNFTQYQALGSSLCGYYCLFVLEELAKGRPYEDVLLDFSYNPDENERFIIEHFSL